MEVKIYIFFKAYQAVLEFCKFYILCKYIWGKSQVKGATDSNFSGKQLQNVICEKKDISRHGGKLQKSLPLEPKTGDINDDKFSLD